ncbi:hypothetical protein JCM9279_000383 [Rhodotorula babjevae]
MYDADELLEWLCVALGWLGGGAGLAEHGHAPVLQASAELYRGRWHLLLPCEQEHALDLALGLVCAAWSPQGVRLNPTSIVFTRFWHDVVRDQQPAHFDALQEAYGRVKVAVDHVRGLYNVAVGLSSFAGYAVVEEASAWATDFLNEAGLSAQTAMRMDIRSLKVVSEQLDELRDELFALARAGDRPLPPVADLPSASAALAQAEHQVAPRHAVYERFKHLFGNLAQLYSDGNLVRIGPRHPQQALDMADVARELARGNFEVYFDALNAEQRHAHVQDARMALYSTYDELHRTGSLPAPILLSAMPLANATNRSAAADLVGANSALGQQGHSSLSSSTSFGSSLDLAALADPPPPLSPKKPDVQLRRLSLSDRSGSDADGDKKDEPARPRRPTPQKRSESFPAYPPAPSSIEKMHNGVSEQELAALPPNPKLWLPSHLSTYLSSTMSLPPPVRADITSFIRSSRLSGRTFLRLREADLEELGINIRWRTALLEARGVLRRESLGGRVLWGFGGAGSAAPPPAAAAAASHRRGGSWQGTCVDVEGSASEDESSKDEWKRSWRASQGVGVRDRVRGLRRAFETVEEASESGTPEKPASVRKALPSAWRHGRSDSAASDMSEASVDSAGGKYAAASASASPSPAQQLDDTFVSSTSSSASSSSCAGRKPPFALDLDLASPAPRLELDRSPAPHSPTSASSSHGTSLPFAAESPAPSRPPSCAPSAQTPRLRPDGTLRAAGAKGGGARRVSFRELSSSSTARGGAGGEGGSDDEDDDPTLRPVRSPLSSPPMSPRTGSLAELFGLDVPRVHAGDTPQRRKREDELVPMFVPGLPQPRDEEDGGGSRRHSKKGSLVLVKKSQLAALQRRMSEVESQLALALGSDGTPSVGGDDDDDEDALGWEYKGEQVDEERLREMQDRIDSLEIRTTHLSTSIPASPTPSARAFASLPSPSASASSMSLSTAYPATSAAASSTSRRRDKHRQRSTSSTMQGSVYSVQTQEDLPGVWPIEGWRQLSGYVVAASIGIGIVAGEVVAAKILGLRRR